ncbi:hypothetical protein [Halothiobacillus sp.]|uniref:hypothetical protein n=1 Tax=Halothiobacillus sp. TaxID=1891311 RepID=UPI003D0E6916
MSTLPSDTIAAIAKEASRAVDLYELDFDIESLEQSSNRHADHFNHLIARAEQVDGSGEYLFRIGVIDGAPVDRVHSALERMESEHLSSFRDYHRMPFNSSEYADRYAQAVSPSDNGAWRDPAASVARFLRDNRDRINTDQTMHALSFVMANDRDQGRQVQGIVVGLNERERDHSVAQYAMNMLRSQGLTTEMSLDDSAAKETVAQRYERLTEGYASNMALAVEALEFARAHHSVMGRDQMEKLTSVIARCDSPSGDYLAKMAAIPGAPVDQIRDELQARGANIHRLHLESTPAPAIAKSPAERTETEVGLSVLRRLSDTEGKSADVNVANALVDLYGKYTQALSITDKNRVASAVVHHDETGRSAYRLSRMDSQIAPALREAMQESGNQGPYLAAIGTSQTFAAAMDRVNESVGAKQGLMDRLTAWVGERKALLVESVASIGKEIGQWMKGKVEPLREVAAAPNMFASMMPQAVPVMSTNRMDTQNSGPRLDL